MSLAGCFVCVLLATLLTFLFRHPTNAAGGNVFWLANGTLLTYLLLAPRRQWPIYLCSGLLAMVGGSALMDGHFQSHMLIVNLLNLCEALIAALLLRFRRSELPRFANIEYLARFLCFAVVAAPAVAGVFFALLEAASHRGSARCAFLSWIFANGLGTAIATPAILAVFQMRAKNHVNWKRNWIYPALLVPVTIAAFAQSSFPILFLVYPLLVLTLLRFGLAWCSISLFLVACASGALTLHGMGPLAAVPIAACTPAILVQRFVATGMFILYSFSAALEKQKTTERKLKEIVNLHTLVTQNSRDVIILADFNGHRSYVSDAAEAMGGWTPEELRQHGSFNLIHPHDKPAVVAAIREMKNGGDGARMELRIRRVNGEYLWVESVLRAIRDPETAAPTGVLNIVRDISERKHAEQQLQDAYRALETLAETDALTHLANRRRFDQYLTNEWRRSLRDQSPLSLLMIDADYFKSYNDTYGHMRGDNALKQIAEAAQSVVTRPGDLVARFGGEEFSVVLPHTDGEGAMQIAQEICMALNNRRLSHSDNPSGYLTISVGVSTMVADFGRHSVNLIEVADQALYLAKKNGRNQVCDGNRL
jgi:diguanylate cyclase (GGDEF)-like protein/PAS domain S-box-containing protein